MHAPYAIVVPIASLALVRHKYDFMMQRAIQDGDPGTVVRNPRFGKKRSAKHRNKSWAKGKSRS